MTKSQLITVHCHQLFQTKYWHGDPQKTAKIKEKMAHDFRSQIAIADGQIFDIGPGLHPWTLADTFVGRPPFSTEGLRPEQKQMMHEADLENYYPWFGRCGNTLNRYYHCSHTIEDLLNPYPILREFEGAPFVYIETPSPLAELCRDVDAGTCIPWRGYRHHHWICWTDADNIFNLVAKHPLIEQFDINPPRSHASMPIVSLAAKIRAEPMAWVNVHTNTKLNFKWRMWRNEVDYDLFDPKSYLEVLDRAMCEFTDRLREQREKWDHDPAD